MNENRQAQPIPATIAVIDELASAAAIADILVREGYVVQAFASFDDARSTMIADPPDLLLFELMLPDSDGLLFWSRIQKEQPLRAIVVTGTRRARDISLALSLGVDDFITKPFRADELLLRVDRVLDGKATADSAATRQLRFGALCVDLSTRRVNVDDVLIELTPIEYRLLTTLMRHPSHTVPRDEINRLVWDANDGVDPKTVNSAVQRLRRKLADAGSASPRIETVRGHGFRIELTDFGSS